MAAPMTKIPIRIGATVVQDPRRVAAVRCPRI